ncbi:MAG TPA: YsnF/AvaK domain-containing protein [Archangium sp.]
MANTVVAVFDEYNEAQGAVDELLVSGFNQNEIKLASEDGTPRDFHVDDKPSTGGVKGFFQSLFGNDERSNLYDEAVKHGNFVVTAIAESDEKSAIASDILSHHHPVDIEQRWQEWFPGDLSMSATELNDSRIGGQDFAEGRLTDLESRAIPVVEEQVKIGKREVQRGGVRIYQRSSEIPIQQDLELSEERVIVDRVPVDRVATDADFKDETFELREMKEEPVIQKQARVVEEVRIGKERTRRTERVREKARRTDVEVQQLDSSDYRSHWQENYASLGSPYEDYAPAYDFGSRMGTQYQGREWDEIEPELQREWSMKNPDSKWERFKDSVKHAFSKRR